MKLATFDIGSTPQIGAVSGRHIIALNQAAPGLPSDMMDLIAVGRASSYLPPWGDQRGDESTLHP